ncbi:MAG: hypothetical protein EBR02_00290 [Alphaproteobacteria bacterium]|nr:hypothetical protein [Alphaproteobacteria bacterium]
MSRSETLREHLVREAEDLRPVAYVNNTRKLRELLKKAFPVDEKVQSILRDSKYTIPEGIIIFSARGEQDITPIIDILAKIADEPGYTSHTLRKYSPFTYKKLELLDGREIYLMSHKSARLYLPKDDDNLMSHRPEAFDEEIEAALQKKIEDNKRPRRTRASTFWTMP